MTVVDRDICFALLKRLYQQNLITHDTYISCCNSRIFDIKHFSSYAEPK